MRIILLIAIFLHFTFTTYAQHYKMEGNELKLEEKIQFKSVNSSELTKEDIDLLKEVTNFLLEKTYISTMRIEGHLSGTAKDQSLSEKRALAIAAYLTQQGIDCKRLIAVGFGNTKPIVGNDSKDAKEQNTRICFVMAALRNKLIGGMPVDGGGMVAGDICTLNAAKK